jgi:hypothetical protein
MSALGTLPRALHRVMGAITTRFFRDIAPICAGPNKFFSFMYVFLSVLTLSMITTKKKEIGWVLVADFFRK